MAERKAPPRRRAAPERVPLIPSWLRVLTVLVVLTPWSVGVMFSILVLKQLPDVAWMAVPSSVIVAVAPAWSIPKRPGGVVDEEPEPPPAPRRRRPSATSRPVSPPEDEWTRWGS
jgi:hypothetical protein